MIAVSYTHLDVYKRQNRRREKRNASLAFKNRRLERQDLELALRSDLSNLWQAYRNNLQLLNLERQNPVSYTHLDVYKRQLQLRTGLAVTLDNIEE